MVEDHLVSCQALNNVTMLFRNIHVAPQLLNVLGHYHNREALAQKNHNVQGFRTNTTYINVYRFAFSCRDLNPSPNVSLASITERKALGSIS